MQTMTVYLIDKSVMTIEVVRPRHSHERNAIYFETPDGCGSFIHLHKEEKWTEDHLCSKHDATRAFLMNESGQTVAKYQFVDWGRANEMQKG